MISTGTKFIHCLVFGICSVLFPLSAAFAQQQAAGDTETATDVPTGHFDIENPAALDDEEASAIYEQIAADMAARYNLSKLPAVKIYQLLRSVVSNVYRATAHGNRYHNIYVNALGKNYLRYLNAGAMPVGTRIFKDSFTVNQTGDVFPGTLALMEKMPPGFNARSGDWRFILVMPDGSIFGSLGGQDSQKVEFCVTCHLEAKQHDYLYFPPADYRIRH